MACHCRTEAGRGQGYTCHYFGDPDDCEAYQESGQTFYGDITEHIAGEGRGEECMREGEEEGGGRRREGERGGRIGEEGG